ncbi:MAG: hypothetical protein ACRBCS_00955 [Cellvibrionaceae bacterium]
MCYFTFFNLRVLLVKLIALLLLISPFASGEDFLAKTFKQSKLINSGFLLDQSPFIVGTARDIETGQFLYTESHYVLENGQKSLVVYSDSKDFVLAEKELNFSVDTSDTRPTLEQFNYLSGEKIKVESIGSLPIIMVKYQETSGHQVENKEIKKTKHLVIDAGFNQLIVNSWALLIKDEKIKFEYLAPSQQSTFTFIASRKDCKNTNLKNALVECFSIAPKSWLMRQFVAPISLVYDGSLKRLLRFSGLGNIGDVKGDYMMVDIEYEYFDKPSSVESSIVGL